MRYYTLFIIFLCTSYCFSQQYEVRISDFDYRAHTTRERCGTNEMWLDIYLKNGQKERVITSTDGTTTYSESIIKTYYSGISSINFHSFIHSKMILDRGWPFPPSCNGPSVSINENIPIEKDCIEKTLYSDSNQDRASTGERAYTSIFFYYEIAPVTKLIQTSYEIGYDDYFSLEVAESSKSFDPSLFKYEYTLVSNPNDWRDLNLKYQYQQNPKIRLSDFLADNVINDKIIFRTKSSCGGQYRSEVVTYTIKKSLPHITSSIPYNTSCYDSDDGKITLFFDRNLEEYENISFSITNIDNYSTNSYANITQLQDNKSYTIENLPAGNYKLKLIGKYKGNPSYSPNSDQFYYFTIQKNSPVNFTFSKTDVYCKGGEDGCIVLSASGGTENSFEYELNNNDQWIAFPSNTRSVTIKNLKKGTYIVNVRDGNKCVAKIQHNEGGKIVLGDIKNIHINISEPEKPLTITYTEKINPKFSGASNGKIVAKVEGGTLSNSSYSFEILKNGTQTITNLATTEFVNNVFYIILNSISKGTYNFTVYDKNYPLATNKEGCSVKNSFIKLTEPQPLKAPIELLKSISCNSQNEFGNEEDKTPYDGQRDESQNGILKIEASGGAPFTGTQNGGKPYIYTWKKQDKNGNWVILDNHTDTARNLSEGKYAINIQDANGIVLGEYNTHTVTKVVDVVYELKEPAKLTLALQKTDATCKGNDGKITATPAGGTPPYTYLWSNGATTASIENLLPMPYTVEIKDKAGCMVQGSTAVLQPNSLTVTSTITPLRCHNAANAAIALAVQGGTAPYQYLWNTGATTANINNLPTGEYKVKITDAQGCAYFKTFTIENPPKFEIDLGENRTLCNGQTLTLNIAINDSQATYLWTGSNGFSSNTPRVTLSEKGTYTATVTTKDGCIATDTITIESANTQIASEFLLTTQAYENEEVILVNTSSPKGETTRWLLPEDDNIEITQQNDDYISIIFKAKGEYRIGIEQTQGNCFELFYKNIIVEPATDLPKTEKTNEAYVREFEVAPNPNNGRFKAKVVLEKAGAIKFRLYSITGQLVNEKNSASATEHWVDFQEPLPAATYILVLETPYQRLSKKIIIIP